VFTQTPERDDEREFRRFVLEAAPTLLRAAAMLSRDFATAEDLMQTTFVRVARRWTTARKAPLAYSRRVLVNLARDDARRLARKPTVPLSDKHLDVTPGADSMARVADRLVLLQAIRALPEPQRAVIVLRFYLELSVGETSKLLSIPEGTVKSATSRALAKLAHVVTPDELEQTRGGIRC
jgi:RNA polymerase sigma-70 factor (sigma-E family)